MFSSLCRRSLRPRGVVHRRGVVGCPGVRAAFVGVVDPRGDNTDDEGRREGVPRGELRGEHAASGESMIVHF